MVNTKAFNEAKAVAIRYKALLESDNFPVKKMIIYGSFAKGVMKEFSDIDVCVVSDKFTRNKDKHETYLWEKAIEVDVRIEPVAYTPKDFINADPLAYEIKKFGVAV
ncbi:MAG: polymerase, beta-like protein region protein [Candidatus Wolfebacteria bacterium GW2011_GWE1_48_7]|uniref:Polymerase, beta-like protein region protein n=2 Tax=Candidatus Wolfeibacteriota TaxID=1752735 RepID=A0A0G1X4A6_9BACT|nr:MAG: polymerase subunit beta protein [Candidatus Wolfebacteria bacterium GW2011_GWB1_47_1]KKU76250.1 MAG: polymerase, beta-like protein region protein [Candidatus Wolfebacteria bacterium GW2011_GWA1_47_6]KKU89255.1 MAG: polymerase, beta-like protein region protein [Candidatus Wolfebacteria bacterium GW2011_GWA2_47_9b]KKU98042.1 MAG: polymerase, beta-like protein region protein [Candidatus Wolfebacteria bacterium GW2011_GWE1_48_7]HAS95220.1 hypothetical protein [Candidatus Wolfebacteria bacte